MDRPGSNQNELDTGNIDIKTGGSVGPPIGKWIKSPLKQTSNSGEYTYQEGGTDREREVPTSQLPHTREIIRGSSKEGREGVTKGRTKKMAKAMETWLKEGRTTLGHKRGQVGRDQGNMEEREGKKDKEKEGEKC